MKLTQYKDDWLVLLLESSQLIATNRQVLTCCRLNMFHPGSVITHNIYMLQAGQHFDFPKDLEYTKQQNQFNESLKIIICFALEHEEHL